MNKFIVFLLLLSASANAAIKKDSIGIERHAGRLFILHRVEAKETLFSLSKKYHISVDEIVTANPEVRQGLRTDAVLKIPGLEKAASPIPAQKHVVQPSETLYSIARKYNVNVEELATINHLDGYNIRIGQEIIIPTVKMSETAPPSDPSKVYHVVKGGETLYSLSRTYGISIEMIKKWNDLPDNTLKPGQQLVVGETAVPDSQNAVRPEPGNRQEPTQVSHHESTEAPDQRGEIIKFEIEDNEYIRHKNNTPEEPLKIEKVFENGLAEMIAGTDDTKKYLALHKTAPVGSILQVKNEMNNLSVFVRVIGKLPDTGDNEKISIRISKIAYDHLGAIDARFPVQISYIPR